MRPAKEILFLGLLGLLGALAAGWCAHLFGSKPTGVLFKYGGLVVSGFLVASKRLNAAFADSEMLYQFDELTRRGYLLALETFKRRFRFRFLAGLFLGGIAVVTGVLLTEATSLTESVLLSLAALGGGSLIGGSALVAGQLLAASWPAEFIAAAKRIAHDDKIRAAKVAAYARDNEGTPIE